MYLAIEINKRNTDYDKIFMVCTDIDIYELCFEGANETQKNAKLVK